MRHRKYKDKISKPKGYRVALLNNLAIALIKNNRITTTIKKAQMASRFVSKLITIAKKNDMHAKRQLFAYLKSRDLVKVMTDEIAPRFANRKGGYTRIIRYKNRIGDGALLAILEFTEIPEVKEKPKKEKKEKTAKTVKESAKSEEKAKAKEGRKEKDEQKKTKKAAKQEEPSEKPSEEAGEEGDKKSGFFSGLRGFLKQ